MKNLLNQQVAAILAEYSIVTEATSPLVGGIQLYISLLLQWNRSISLTTVTDPEEIVRFHFGEGLFAASSVPITHGRLADVGTGAGFPGLPLRMLIPSLDLTLIESNAKKAAFLEEVVRKLAPDRVHISRSRMEDLETGGPIPAPSFDFITARAFGQFDGLLAWSKGHLARPGKLVLWLGKQDVTAISQRGDWNWSAPQQIPGSDRRFILSGMPR
jgi:16S rRNA (guanine527-N7)-methyltransferase